MHVFGFVYEILCIVGSSKQLSALWSDQPFCRLHILVQHPIFFFYKMLAIRSMTYTYFNVISKLLIHEFCMFYFLKKRLFFPYVDL